MSYVVLIAILIFGISLFERMGSKKKKPPLSAMDRNPDSRTTGVLHSNSESRPETVPPHWTFSCIGFKNNFVKDLVSNSRIIYCIADSENGEANLYSSKDLGMKWEKMTVPLIKYLWKLHLFQNGTLLLFLSQLQEKGKKCLVYDERNNAWNPAGKGLPVDHFFMIADSFIDDHDRLFIKMMVEGQERQSLVWSKDYGRTFDPVVEELTAYFVTYDVPSLAPEYRGKHQLLYSTNHLDRGTSTGGHLHIIDIDKRRQQPVVIPFEEMRGNQSFSVLTDRHRTGVLYVTGDSTNFIYESTDFAKTWRRLPLLPFPENARYVTFWGYRDPEPDLPLLSVEESDRSLLTFWNVKESRLFPAGSMPEGCLIRSIQSVSGGRVILATTKGVFRGDILK